MSDADDEAKAYFVRWQWILRYNINAIARHQHRKEFRQTKLRIDWRKMRKNFFLPGLRQSPKMRRATAFKGIWRT